MSDGPTPAPTLTDERVRMLYASAYAWRIHDDIDDGETDLSDVRARMGAEFDAWLAAVKERAARAMAERIAEQAENSINHDPDHYANCPTCQAARHHANEARIIGGLK